MNDRSLAPLVALLVLVQLGCGDPEPARIDFVLDQGDCEWINPERCMLPWPSDRWLVPDESTATGLRLQYDPAVLPVNKDGVWVDVSPYARFDGFSPSSQIMTLLPKAVDLSNLAAWEQWDDSLAPDSPTVLLNLDTGERVPHMVEIDARARMDLAEDDDSDVPVLLYLRPATRLQEGSRYGVALRHIRLVDGSDAQPSATFAVLRAAVLTSNDTIEAARPGYESLFAGLEAAGVPRSELVQAWSFHTASGEMIRGDLLQMRDDAMERVPPGGGSCVIENVIEQPWSGIAYQLRGTFDVPLYMDSRVAPARVVRGADGLPVFQSTVPIDFVANVPESLLQPGAAPGRLIQIGHGLMGSATQTLGFDLARHFSAVRGAVTIGTNIQGMSTPDVINVGNALAEISGFASVGERLMQGVINQLVLTRSFLGGCASLPELQGADGGSVIAPGEAYYIGVSMGAIFGGTIMTVSQDFERGGLLVGGMNFPLLITRSLNWIDFEDILLAWYSDRVDRELLMAMTSSLWDLAAPDSWLPHTLLGDLPGTPAKQVLLAVGKGDLQVQNIASNLAARTMGLPLLQPSPVPVWGLDEQAGPLPSAFAYYDLNAELPPEENLLPDDINNVHTSVQSIGALRDQLNAFFQPGGMVVNFCDGTCDPE